MISWRLEQTQWGNVECSECVEDGENGAGGGGARVQCSGERCRRPSPSRAPRGGDDLPGFAGSLLGSWEITRELLGFTGISPHFLGSLKISCVYLFAIIVKQAVKDH